MISTLRIAFVAATVVVVGVQFVGDPPTPTASAATSSASGLVGDPGALARRLGNQRVVADPPPPPPKPSAGVAGVASEVIRITNVQRQAAGLSPVAAHPQLMSAALAHSNDQAAMQRMSHTGSDGSSAGDRITRAGYRWRTWGENVAMGYSSADAAMDGWMNSPGHRANILSSSMVDIGVAAVTGADGRIYWTMVLAAPGA